MPTKIPWADEVLNPVAGCTKVGSPGGACDNCYAEKMAVRLAYMPNIKIANKYRPTVDDSGRWTGHVSLDIGEMDKALKWKKPRRIFIASMGDLFHEGVPFEFIDRIFAIMASSPQHVFMLLTKRVQRAAEYFAPIGGTTRRDWVFSAVGRELNACRVKSFDWPLPNVWLGTTAENQARADERIPTLLQIPAAKRFVSIEPMLGAVDVSPYLPGCYECNMTCGFRGGENYIPEYGCIKCGHEAPMDDESWGNDPSYDKCPKCGYETDDFEKPCPDCSEGELVQYHPDTVCLDWVIVGQETGPGARPAKAEWFNNIIVQCRSAGTPVFVKKAPEGVEIIREFPTTEA